MASIKWILPTSELFFFQCTLNKSLTDLAVLAILLR